MILYRLCCSETSLLKNTFITSIRSSKAWFLNMSNVEISFDTQMSFHLPCYVCSKHCATYVLLT